MAAPNFIGIDNVKHVADQLQPNIIMGPAYFNKDELKRLGIKVITGVQFKNTAMVLNRKGGTSRRKVVGTPIESKIGYLTERVMTARIVWNRYRHNEDEFAEKPIQIEGSANFHYPLTEEMISAIGKTFSEDVYACLFFGDESSDNASLQLFDGYQTLLNKDIESGAVSTALGNLVPSKAIDKSAGEGDATPWLNWVEWYDKWSPALKRQNVLCYMSIENGHNIAAGYAQLNRGLDKVQYIPDANGNFKVSEYPKVTFVPSDDFGKGDRMFACPAGNLELGVNTEGAESFVAVQHGSDDDVALPRLGECILPVGLLTGVDLAMQELIFPCALVAQLTILGFNLFRPVAAAAIDDVHVGGLALGHSFEELHDVRLFGGVVKLFPEIGHGGIAIVAAHRPDGVGVGSRHEHRRVLP